MMTHGHLSSSLTLSIDMIDSTKRYEYFAFISYKREDEKWANWLQHKLEYYKLPSSVRKDNPDLPDKIRPVFKDTTDLEPGVLAQKIQVALNSSKFLIVICSPRSANSIWVSKEVQSFIDSGRANHIIPFIIDGTPNASAPKDECFPKGLRQLTGEQELLGANINEMGREAAIIKVVARMFNLRFDSLWQRFERDKKRRLGFVYTGAIFLFILLIIMGILYYDRNETYLQLESSNEKLASAYERLREDSILTVSHLMRIQSDSVILSAKNDSIIDVLESLKRARGQIETEKKKQNEIREMSIQVVTALTGGEAMDSVLILKYSLAMAMDKENREKLQRDIAKRKDMDSNKDNENVLKADLSKLNNPVSSVGTFGMQ